MSESTARSLIRIIASDRGLTPSVHVINGRVLLELADPKTGEVWRAAGDDLYQAACALAELLGWDLEG